jgi:hypothetical protein
MIEKKFQKMTITLDNVNQAQAIALKQMFEHMEYLGKIGASRWCQFMADGDGDFRPKVTIDYPEQLPEVKTDGVNEDTLDFKIDYDGIAWEIYH